ncbi:MAG: hypothetical protein ACYCSN_19345 [Acidobacteriaceae bacterium]
MSDIFFSSGLVASTEVITLSTWLNHPVDGRTPIDRQFRLNWLRTSESTLELTHGGHVLDTRNAGTYVDNTIFDSFQNILQMNFMPLCEKHGIGPDSTLIALVRTTIKDMPVLALDDAFPGPRTRYDEDENQRSIKKNIEREAKGWHGRYWRRVPEGWGIKIPNEFAHEPGQPSHLIPTLRDREVASIVVWDSKRGMPRDPEDVIAIKTDLQARFGSALGLI